MPIPIIGVIAALAGVAGKLLATESIKFIATRALLYTLFTLVLPVILYNVFAKILQETLTYAMNQAGSASFEGSVVHLTGIAAWIADNIYLSQAMSIFLSAVALRFVLSMIKR